MSDSSKLDAAVVPALGHRLIAFALIFLPIIEGLILSLIVDARQEALLGGDSILLAALAHAGSVAKLGVLVLVLGAFVFKARAPIQAQQVSFELSRQRFYRLLPIQLAAFICCLIASRLVFAAGAINANVIFALLWCVSVAAVVCSWMAMWASWQRWCQMIRCYRLPLLLVLVVAALIWVLALNSQQLWGPLAEASFSVALLLLLLIDKQSIYVDFDDHLLGLGDFVVHVAPACSGVEGLGLALGFTSIYLYCYASELRFPRALILLPIAALSVWLLNCVRIALLIVIGNSYSPELAVGGFHSQAGWLGFIASTLLVLWLAGGSVLLRKTKAEDSEDVITVPTKGRKTWRLPELNLATACLLPMVSLLAMLMLSAVSQSGFDWLYIARSAILILVFWYCWPWLGPELTRKWTFQPLTVSIGIAVAVMWCLLPADYTDADRLISDTLNSHSQWLAALWLVARFVGAVLLIPIAEELAFRVYMLSRLSSCELDLRHRQRLSLFAILLSSLAFGVLHQSWGAGTVAGLAYAYLKWRHGRIIEAIIAHATSNLLIYVFAAYTGRWSLL